MEETMDVDVYHLLDFPDEVLLHLFGYFDDKSLLSATRVCKRFKRLTEVAVANKYDGQYENKYYNIEDFEGTSENGKNEIKQHIPFLITFGRKINAVRAIFIHKNADEKHWIIRLLKRHLKSVSDVALQKSFNYFGPIIDDYTKLDLLDVISNFPMLSSLELFGIKPKDSEWAGLHICSLVELNMSNMLNVSSQTLKRFLNNNPQLEKIQIGNTMNITVDIFNDMPNLVELHLENDGDADESMVLIKEDSNINLPNLLKISTDGQTKSLFHVIGAGCKNIESFIVHKMNPMQKFKIDDHQVNIICSLKKLSNIWTDCVCFNSRQVNKMISELPNLVRLAFVYNGDISNDSIGNILENTRQNPKLNRIIIYSETTLFENLPTMSEMHQVFKHFANSNSTLKLILGPWKHIKTVLITKKKIFVDGKLVYWAAYPKIIQPSEKVSFIQLNDKCLSFIINKLKFDDQLALYQTCAKMRDLVGPKLQAKYALHPFGIQRNLRLEETYLRFFGKSITSICFDYKYCDNDQASQHWNLINRYCNKTLNELTLKHLKMDQNLSDLKGAAFLFPNLKKLIFVKSELNIFHASEWLYSIGPTITHLEFDDESEIAGESIIMKNTFDSLTILRFGRYCDAVGLFLDALNQIVCDNLLELSLVNVCEITEDEDLTYKLDNGILNTVARFSKLKKLDLIIKGIEQTNMKFLFESCSNLEELSLSLVEYSEFEWNQERFEIIKKSCPNLKKLKLLIVRWEIKYFVKALRKTLDIFSGVIIEVLEIDSQLSNHVHKYNLSYELLNNWDKKPISTFLTATK